MPIQQPPNAPTPSHLMQPTPMPFQNPYQPASNPWDMYYWNMYYAQAAQAQTAAYAEMAYREEMARKYVKTKSIMQNKIKYLKKIKTI